MISGPKGNKMKLKMNIVFVVLMFVFLSPMSASAWYYAIGAGTGGQAEANSFTMAFGKEDIKIKKLTAIAGIAVPLILHGDSNVPSNTNDSSCPHGSCSSKGSEDDGTETGLIGSFGLELFDWSTYVSLLGGVTRANTVKLSQSNITGQYYKEGTGTEYYPVFGLGVSYAPVFFEWKLKMLFSLEFDNRRGITGMIGWCW